MQLRKHRLSLMLMILMLCLAMAQAQSGINEVHVAPRVQQTDTLHSLAQGATGLIRTHVDLVLVPVTVMDESHRIVTDLRQENFVLSEDKRSQSIKHFWKEDEPVSVGVVLDVSGSMKTKIDRAREAVAALLAGSNPQDEFFLVIFADNPTLIHDFTKNTDELHGSLVLAEPKGRTALLDALVLAVNNMKKAQYRRKALVVISDGGDNYSRYTEKEVKSLVKEADVMVYSIGVFDTEFWTMEERLGPELLAGLSSLTGASAYTLDNPVYLPLITGQIAAEIRHQYILGYRPDNSRRDGKWRKIKVDLAAIPHGLSALHVQARKGYYGPSQ